MVLAKMNLSDMPDALRMELRDKLTDLGCHIEGYYGPDFQVALPRRPGIRTAIREAGFDLHDAYCFPLGTDGPPEEFRHGSATYPGSRSFWLLARATPLVPEGWDQVTPLEDFVF